MWDLFSLAVLASLLLLMAPGYFIFRALGFSRISSFECAPLASLLLCSFLTTAFWKIGVFCTWWLLALSSLLISFFVYALAVRFKGVLACGDAPLLKSSRDFAQSSLCALSYVAVAALVYIFVFALNVDDASSFVQYYDNMHHLGSIQTFLLSGNWSSFGTTSYPDTFGSGVSPVESSSGFYPSAWHCIAAFAAGLTGCSVPVAENASIAAFVVVVFPLGMHALMNRLFVDKPRAVIFASLVVSAFAFYPWRLMTFGPLYPNIASMSLIPGAAYLFLELVSGDRNRVRDKASLTIAFVFALGSMAFTQPNTVFALGVFLAPYIVCLASSAHIRGKRTTATRLMCGMVAVVAILGMWLVCYKLPFLQGVITYSWPSYTSAKQALLDVFYLRFLYHPSQAVLAIATIVGIVSALVDRKRAWLVVSYGIACCMYVVDAYSDGVLRHLLTGFWYTDPNRVIAFLIVFAMPLASWGLATIVELCVKLLTACAKRFASFGLSGARLDFAARIVGVALIACFTLWNYWPHCLITGEVDSENPFDIAGLFVRDAFQDCHNGYYDHQESQFVESAMRLVGTEKGMVNIPSDGSASAYGADGANVLYRYYDEANSSSEKELSRVVRLDLAEVSTSRTVQEAVRDLNVGYVLKLDRGGHGGTGHYDFCYSEDDWRGIDAVNDDTPGFEVILAEGDMRLYRITAA